MGDTKNTSNSSGHTADEFATFFADKVKVQVRQVRQSTSSRYCSHYEAGTEWMGTRHAGGRGKADRQCNEQELSAGRCSDMAD